MIPYYSPNFYIKDLVKSIFCRDADQRLVQYFQKLTGKKYVLATSSCRSALYLAYQSIGIQGVVHTSPLTCKVALMPIIASNNKICFHDVRKNDWTIDPETISQLITNKSIAIQAIHLGGFPCDMAALRSIADENGLLLIEDCAQGFASSYSGVATGTISDIACFTLSKNVYGIGGGILATNNYNWYCKARDLQATFPPQSPLKTLNRVISALASSMLTGNLFELVFWMLSKLKKGCLSTRYNSNYIILLKELKRPCKLYAKTFVARIGKIENLNNRRKILAHQMISSLMFQGYRFQNNVNSVSGFTKLFSIHKDVTAFRSVKSLNTNGVEAMHLEHKYKTYYQEKLLELGDSKKLNVKDLPVYQYVHDRLISWPIFESMNDRQLQQIVSNSKHLLSR